MASGSTQGSSKLHPYASALPTTAVLAANPNSVSSSVQHIPFVKFNGHPFLIEYFRTCSASVRLAEIRLHHGAIVSFPDENALSQGTPEAWIGMISIAIQNM